MEISTRRGTPLTLCYLALWEKQEEVRSYLTYNQARARIESTPGAVFDPGTTFEDVLKKLERYGMVAIDKSTERVFVISSERLEKRLQSSPKCTPYQEAIKKGPDCPGGRPGGSATLHF
jgi:hypothetical protein